MTILKSLFKNPRIFADLRKNYVWYSLFTDTVWYSCYRD